VVGSVIVFTLYLYVIVRWTASATSYSMLLMPLVAVVVASFRFGEPITLAVLAGGALVLVGVYFGAFAPSVARPLPGLLRRVPRTAGASVGPPTLQNPNCP
jgi:drug/metabolite transporter (DMT)-like permease